MKIKKFIIIFFQVVLLISSTAFCYDVGDKYILDRQGKTIPGHPDAGDRSVSIRFPHGSIAEIMAKDSVTGWYEIKVDNDTAWIIEKYFGEKYSPPPQEAAYSIGTWNLEWFHNNKTRGFPENTRGGATYQHRTDEDISAIAEVISSELKSAILVLTEINGYTSNGEAKSNELDELIEDLGPNFSYVISHSGKSQKVAILYDTNKVRLNHVEEFEIPYESSQNKDIFARDPFLGHFTFIQNGTSLNDILVVGLHLASGQMNNKNHDKAMQLLLDKLDSYLEDGADLHGEEDIVLMGDLNLNIFDSEKELVLEQMETGPYDILADNNYPATRLAHVPLVPNSKIDYIIVTDEMRGAGKEVSTSQATVHQEIANGDYDNYRRVFSDHFPVTVGVKVFGDDD